ncbi:ATP-binding protein [Pseudonocardia sp.]|uniref:sensor histidine kinase n=1 Tax=Pseudonocardia sp. TaxID=60912 RepID=UPI0026098F04|nr:ATP-binding protein [Pseudonocardia sp.]
MRTATGRSGHRDALQRFDLALQRAIGAGLAVALVVALATAVLGRSLYPAWWWLAVAPVVFGWTAAAVWLCLVGRFGTSARVLFTLVVGGSAIGAAIATDSAVRDASTAVLPVVVIAIVGVGFLAAPPVALVLGAILITGSTLGPFAMRPGTSWLLLTESAIQTVILGSAIAGGHVARRFASAEERALDEVATATVADRAAAAARAERRELEREVHDTVLSTLSALGRASLADTAALRERCAADARFLRSRGGQGTGPPTGLREQLEAIVEPFVATGFPVRLTVTAPQVQLPPVVARSLARATREALTNARRHSGAGCAQVQVRSWPGGVEVRVVDAGIGLRAAAQDRLGTRRSLVERLGDVGGLATVRSGTEAGTTVTLRWPR